MPGFSDAMGYNPYYSNYSGTPLGVKAMKISQAVYTNRDPVWSHIMMDQLRGIFGSAAALRTRAHARTITRGPLKSERLRQFAEKDIFGHGKKASWSEFRRTMMMHAVPQTWWKLPTMQVFDPMKLDMAGGMFIRGKEVWEEGQNPRATRAVERIIGKTRLQGRLQEFGAMDEKGRFGHFFDPAGFSRFSAANTWDRMARRGAGVMSEADRANLMDYLKNANAPIAHALETTGRDLTYRDAAQLTRMAMRMPMTARMAGYYEGLRNGITADGMARRSLMNEIALNNPAAADAYLSGQADANLRIALREEGGLLKGRGALAEKLSGMSAEDLAASGMEKFAGKTAFQLGTRALATTGLEIGGALSEGFLNPVMDAMAAYGVAKLAGNIVTHAVTGTIHTIEGAYTSFVGDINKAPMGMGYKDTLAASTSRSRGVLAIQNSRLNARSVLGNEAGAIAAHFGY